MKIELTKELAEAIIRMDDASGTFIIRLTNKQIVAWNALYCTSLRGTVMQFELTRTLAEAIVRVEDRVFNKCLGPTLLEPCKDWHRLVLAARDKLTGDSNEA